MKGADRREALNLLIEHFEAGSDPNWRTIYTQRLVDALGGRLIVSQMESSHAATYAACLLARWKDTPHD